VSGGLGISRGGEGGAGWGRWRRGRPGGAWGWGPAPGPGGERAPQRLGGDLACLARKPHELDSTAEEFRRAAFVRCDVRLVMAEHGAPGRGEMRQRERVRGGSGGHQGDRALPGANFRQAPPPPPPPTTLPP